MRLELFGIGTQSYSKAITAQRRINCFVEPRRELDRTRFALIGRPGLRAFLSGRANTSRGMWAVNSLSTPLLFFVQGDTLFSCTGAGALTTIGTLTTSTGDVSLVDNGTYLMLVDGTNGYYYNMVTPGALTTITDGNFTTSPTTVTWQDTYFIVTSAAATKQFQLSDNDDPATWPAVNINFAGAGAGKIQAGIVDHSILHVFGDVYTEFLQNAGLPGFPFAFIPGAAQQFGLAARWSLAKFDNSLVGLFRDDSGNINVSRMQGFALQRLSDSDMEQTFQRYSAVADAQGFAFTTEGHPFYVINFPAASQAWMYDALSGIWSELQSTAGDEFWGTKFARLDNRLLISDRRNGNIYQIDATAYDDAGSALPMAVYSKHIWQDDKFVGIQQVQVDVQSGVGTAGGQGENPVVDLLVSKDGGNSFYSVGYSSAGKIGEYTQRLIWGRLGAARDWVLGLRITDPVKRVITGASVVARF